MRAAILHIVALAAVGVAQPVYDLFSRHPDFFVAHDARPADLLTLVLLVSVAVPAAIVGVEGCLALVSRRAAWVLHLVVVAALSGLIAAEAAEAGGMLATDSHWLPALMMIALGSLAALGYARFELLRSFLSLLSLSALVFPLLFLFVSPVRPLLLPAEGPRTHRVHIESQAPVVILVLDELPLTSLLDAKGDIDAVRYPNFARFAAHAYWFRDATTVAERTPLALPAILTGRYPDGKRLVTAEEYPENLFSLFAGSHRFSVFETVSRLCPAELCSSELVPRKGMGRLHAMLADASVAGLHVLLPGAWTTWLPAVTETWADFGVEERVQEPGAAPAFQDLVYERRHDSPWLHDSFLRSFSAGGDRTLFFLHLLMPHVPWRYLPSGHEYRPASIFPTGLVEGDRDLWGEDEWPVTQAAQRHLLQVGYTDRLLGEMLDALQETGIYDSALVAIVSDHGVGLSAGQRRRGLSQENLAEILSVPMLIKRPWQQEGVVDERNAETIDLLPSIADALGAELPWPVDGHSLFDLSLPEREWKVAFKRSRDKRSYSRLELAPSEIRAQRERRTLRLNALFGTGAIDPALYAIGPHAELIGSEVTRLRVARADPVVGISLDRPARQHLNVEPEALLQPVHITGAVRSRRGPVKNLALAVAVNGTLRAMTRTIEARGKRARFAAMIPESALLPGRNDLEIYVVAEDAEGIVLEPTWRSGPL